jgi:hypothetical protein
MRKMRRRDGAAGCTAYAGFRIRRMNGSCERPPL